jgi:hypothetical protein
VVILTLLRLDNRGFSILFPPGARDFSLLRPPVQWALAHLLLGVKRPRSEAGHSFHPVPVLGMSRFMSPHNHSP